MLHRSCWSLPLRGVLPAKLPAGVHGAAKGLLAIEDENDPEFFCSHTESGLDFAHIHECPGLALVARTYTFFAHEKIGFGGLSEN